MSECIYINNIDSTPEWKKILTTVIEYSDEFAIVFPNGEYDADNPLLAGMLDFKNLPNISVSPWPNMKDSSVYRAELNDTSRNLILNYTLNDTFDSLWNFSLYKGDLEVLNVADFSECFIYPDPEVIMLVTQNGIDLSRFDKW
ncbi:hypothetical protein HMPREF1210_00114 [Paenisporosarcina sp. HGH0030]|uniref:hypothetical protein n=1 Tax=Paenisporosarcina sp. HGH0030 TaxID=1078085 RepID=UPI00034E1F53|nr:hypothetical protein [Paenisporosarcina sp. HGH0030]EPD54129.1 hypothetical protein HMPREF1210_00114 [Paenisporosarcina sp. HGH0030]